LRFGKKNAKRTGVLVRAHTQSGLQPHKTPSNLQYFSAKNQSEFVSEPKNNDSKGYKNENHDKMFFKYIFFPRHHHRQTPKKVLK